VVVCETLGSGMLQAQSPDWFVGLAASTARTYGATVQHDDRDRGSSGLWSVRPQDVREGWMATEDRPVESEALTTEVALDQWREAERAAAVARRGRVAAQAAADAASDAASAAKATAEAARAALASMELAETSAAKTAAAARLFVQEARADLADAETDSAMSDVAEADAHNVYRAAIDRAEGR
jgi:hypothetical protein